LGFYLRRNGATAQRHNGATAQRHNGSNGIIMNKLRRADNLWYEVENVRELFSPSLLTYPDRIERNIETMISMAGGVEKLRPHVKTHKMPEVVKLQMKHGIHKFKCATISEAEMVARCGANDILLAMQPVGPNIERFFKLILSFPETKISCIADNSEVIMLVAEMAIKKNIEATVWLDINNGMNRTGIEPGTKAKDLYNLILRSPKLKAGGLHAYDGHIYESDFSQRKIKSDDAFSKVIKLINELEDERTPNIKIVAGGTPSFPIHAKRKGVECSPGTLLLWDYKSDSSYPDMNFIPAAVLLSRIISKPDKDLICLDLGHKAVASEIPQPRIKFLGMDNYTIINHNEEHMVISTPEAGKYKVGDHLYGIPWHICPTVDRYDSVYVVRDNIVSEQWDVEARRRMISI
jgi:D-serine deaminase-like pyridoxal phosphate-dependent protein